MAWFIYHWDLIFISVAQPPIPVVLPSLLVLHSNFSRRRGIIKKKKVSKISEVEDDSYISTDFERKDQDKGGKGTQVDEILQGM